MFCTNCGTENPDTNKFCIDCGAALRPASPAAPGAETPRPIPVPPVRSKRQMKWLGPFVAVGGVAVLLVAIIVAAVFLLPRILPTGKQVMLGFPSRSGDADLYLLKLGQEKDEGVLIAEDTGASSQAYFVLVDDKQVWRRIGGEYGGFVPNSNRVLYWYQDDEDVVLREIGVGDKESSEIIATDALPLLGIVFDDSDTMFLQETRDNQHRCYAAGPGQEAERLAKGDECGVSSDGRTVYFSELDDDERTVSIIGIDGKNETVVLDEVKDVVSVRVSDDASHVAYLQQADGEQQLYLVERSSGTATDASAELFSILEYSFVPDSDTLLYIAENDEGALQLYTSDNPTPIAEGVSLGASAAPDGQHLVYMVEDEDGEGTVYVYAMKGGDDVNVLTEDNLEYNVIPSPAKILIQAVEDGEVTLYSADVNGANVVELYNEDDVNRVDVHYVPNESMLYLLVSNDDGTTTLSVTPMDKAEGFPLLEEWHQIALLNRSGSGRHLVFWGQEDRGDDPILYSIAIEDGADPIELDDDNDGFNNAVFTADGKSIVYTAVTGSNPDDVDVCQVPVDGSDKFEVLYKEAFLADVQWDELNPFQQVWWRTVRSGTSFCPGVPSVGVGETVEGKTETGEQVCYRFHAQEGDVVTFDVDTPESQRYNFALTFYDREGHQVSYNDDGPSGYDPRLTVSINQTGLYFVMLTGYGSAEQATYSLTVQEGSGAPAKAPFECTDAIGCVDIPPGDPIRIGYALVIVGPNASLGIDSRRGIEIALEDKGWEFLGHPIELVGEDSMCSAEGGQTALTKLTSDPSLIGVIGTNCSSAGVQASRITSDAGIVMISPSNTAPSLTNPDLAWNPGYLRTCRNDKVQGAAMAKYVYGELGLRTAATIHDGSPYADQLQQVFADTFRELGGTITVQGTVNIGDTDMRRTLATIAADSPEFLYYPVFIPEGARITVQAKEIPGLENTHLAGADGVYSPDFVEAAGEAAEGMYISSPNLAFDNPLYDHFLEVHQTRYGEAPLSVFHAHAYDGTNMILAAIEKAAVQDEDGRLYIGRQALRDALYGTRNFGGITGTLNCDEYGDCAAPQIEVNQIQNGEYVPLWEYLP